MIANSQSQQKSRQAPARHESFSKKPEKSLIDDDLMSDVFNELALLEETILAIESEPPIRSRTTSLTSLMSPNEVVGSTTGGSVTGSGNFPLYSPGGTSRRIASAAAASTSTTSSVVADRLERELMQEEFYEGQHSGGGGGGGGEGGGGGAGGGEEEEGGGEGHERMRNRKKRKRDWIATGAQ